jgi:hypothetical protein
MTESTDTPPQERGRSRVRTPQTGRCRRGERQASSSSQRETNETPSRRSVRFNLQPRHTEGPRFFSPQETTPVSEAALDNIEAHPHSSPSPWNMNKEAK